MGRLHAMKDGFNDGPAVCIPTALRNRESVCLQPSRTEAPHREDAALTVRLALTINHHGSLAMSCTGYAARHLPPGPETDEIIGMVRVVVAWRNSQSGRRPGPVHNYLLEVADKLSPCLSFDALVIELRIRVLRGDDADMILDDVDTGAETVRWCEPGKDCHTMPFSTLQNKWSKVRQIKSNGNSINRWRDPENTIYGKKQGLYPQSYRKETK